MNSFARRFIHLAVMTVGLASLFVALNAVPGAATPPSQGFSSQVLARGTDMSRGTLPTRVGSDIVVAVISQKNKGDTSGWHSHPGGAIVVVQKGEVTVYRSVRKDEADNNEAGNGDSSPSDCVINVYKAGQSFIERPGEVVIANNTGPGELVLYAIFPSVPVGGSSRIDQPDPGTCPGV